MEVIYLREHKNEETTACNHDSGLVKFRPMNEIIRENRAKRKVRYNKLLDKMEKILRGKQN